MHKDLERGWDARSHVCASSNFECHENYREHFDSPKPIDLFTQERFTPASIGTNRSNFSSSSQSYRQQHDKSLVSKMTGTAYIKTEHRRSPKHNLTKPWSRPKSTPAQSRNQRTKSPHFVESTCSDPARKGNTSKAIAKIDVALERGWDGRFSMTTSLHNHQLHDCQREYFDVPRQQDAYTQARPGYPGVATTNSR